MLAKKCDRCGEYYDGYSYILAIINRKELERKDIDLCPRCSTDFESWMTKIPERGVENAK